MKRSAEPNSDKMRAEFRQKLENYQAAPSENLWDKIELSLDKEEALVYKNRFRIYSRLAAACLLLLLAFGVFFIPNKLKKLQSETSGLAATQNPETDNIPTVNQPKIKENITAPAQIASTQNASENTQTDNSFISSKETALTKEKTLAVASKEIRPRKIAFSAEPVTSRKAEKRGSSGNALPEKTLAFNRAKGISNAQLPAINNVVSDVVTPQNAMVSAAKTARTHTAASETVNKTQTGMMASESAIGAISEAENNSNETAPAIAYNNPKSETQNKTPQPAINKIPAVNNEAAFQKKSKITSAATPESTFRDQNYTVSLKKERRKPLPFLTNDQLQTLARNTPLPDTTTLPQIPVAESTAKMKTAKPETDETAKPGKWVVALAYSGRSYFAGMQLASQARFDSSGSLSSYQQQNENIALYKAAIREFNRQTRSGYSQGSALQISYKLSEAWLIQSGFTYFRHQAKTASHYAFLNQTVGNSVISQPATQEPQTALLIALNNNFDPVSTKVLPIAASTTTYIFEQIGLPVNLRYQSNSPDWYYFAAAGFSLNLRTSTTIKTEESQINYPVFNSKAKKTDIQNQQEKAFRNWLPALGFQTGIGYHLSGRWQVEIALEGDHFLKPLIQAENAAGASQKKPMSLGGSVKLGYSF